MERPYDPTEAALEAAVWEADQANRAALRAPILPKQSYAYLNRIREAAAALGLAAEKLDAYRRQRDPEAYEADLAHADACAGEEYYNR